MNTKLKVLIVIVLVLVSAGLSGSFFATNFLVSPVFIKFRNPIIKRTSAQEYAQREAQMIKEASQWILDYQQDEATRLRFSEDVKNVMEK
jgi:hypothetical protein